MSKGNNRRKPSRDAPFDQATSSLGHPLGQRQQTEGSRTIKERVLQGYLAGNIRHVFSAVGLDLMLFGSEMVLGPRCRADLIAIDARGDLYVIELKVRATRADVITQVIDYHRSVTTKNKRELLELYLRYNGAALEIDFERHFAAPLPPRVNRATRILIVAHSYDRQTIANILDLRAAAYPIQAYSYEVEQNEVALVAARSTACDSALQRGAGLEVRGDIQQFWDECARQIISDIFTFRAMHRRYVEWLQQRPAEWGHVEIAQWGEFGKALATLAAGSDKWRQVFVPTEHDPDPFEVGASDVPNRPRRAAGYTVLAYAKAR